jgi:hypothetical protein
MKGPLPVIRALFLVTHLTIMKANGGGVIESVSGSLQLVDSNLTKNYSKGHGGGLAILGGKVSYISPQSTRIRQIYREEASLLKEI